MSVPQPFPTGFLQKPLRSNGSGHPAFPQRHHSGFQGWGDPQGDPWGIPLGGSLGGSLGEDPCGGSLGWEGSLGGSLRGIPHGWIPTGELLGGSLGGIIQGRPLSVGHQTTPSHTLIRSAPFSSQVELQGGIPGGEAPGEIPLGGSKGRSHGLHARAVLGIQPSHGGPQGIISPGGNPWGSKVGGGA